LSPPCQARGRLCSLCSRPRHPDVFLLVAVGRYRSRPRHPRRLEFLLLGLWVWLCFFLAYLLKIILLEEK